jgi:hypothetical protein
MELSYERAVELIENAEEVRTWVSINEDYGESIRVNKEDVISLIERRHKEVIKQDGLVDTSTYKVSLIEYSGEIICIGV